MWRKCLMLVLLTAWLPSGRLAAPEAPAPSFQSLTPNCPQTWQAAYTRLHNSILAAAPKDQRLVVFDATASGLSDRMFSVVSGFYLALLSGRAFKIKWQGPFRLESACLQPNINWTLADSDLSPEGLMQLDFYGDGGNKGPLQQLFSHEDFAARAGRARAVRMTSNQAQLNRLFNNPHYRGALEQWGLHPETAFGCAYNFLFAPTPEVMQSVQPAYERVTAALASQQATMARLLDPAAGAAPAPPPKPTHIIGIQIRFPDEYFAPESHCHFSPQDGAARSHFQCAEQLTSQLTAQGSGEVLWLLVTNCVGLKKLAREAFGDKLLAAELETIDHSLDTRQHKVEGFYSSFGESWLLSLANYHVISEFSCFGRLAALRSMRLRNVFTIPHTGAHRQCGLDNYDVFRDIAMHWTQVRRTQRRRTAA